jgi:hypothetical protein
MSRDFEVLHRRRAFDNSQNKTEMKFSKNIIEQRAHITLLACEVSVVPLSPYTSNGMNYSRIHYLLHKLTTYSIASHNQSENRRKIKHLISPLHKPVPKLISNSASKKYMLKGFMLFSAKTTNGNYITSDEGPTSRGSIFVPKKFVPGNLLSMTNQKVIR